jgi:glycosyltransferase involved in cell wall biosynthesis
VIAADPVAANTPVVARASARVCVLTAAHNPFDQRVFYKEAVSLAEAGYDVTLIAPARDEVRGTHRGVHIEPVPVPSSRRRRFALQRQLLRRARRLRADIYHLHDPELLPLGWLLRRFGHRVVYDVHENFAAAALTRQWVPRWLRRPLSRAVDVSERRIARRLSGVVGVVDEQQQRFGDCHFTTVRNFPRLEWFGPRPADAPADGAELVHVGSLSPERGSRFLLEILRELVTTHPRVRLNALGPFHTRADEELFHATVRDYGLQENVVWRTERMPYEELGRFIAGHRIGLIPGQASPKNLTPFVPTKLFEYLACGVPVVASALPSIVGFRQRGEWGVVADPACPATHAAAIARLLDEPAETRRLGEEGRRLVESMYNWETEAQNLLRLYAELLEDSSEHGSRKHGATPATRTIDR